MKKEKSPRNPKALSTTRHIKDKHFRDQKQAIYLFFCNNHSTTYGASEGTGITRPNCTRYVRMLEDDGLIERTHQGICPISKEPGVWYFTKRKTDDNV